MARIPYKYDGSQGGQVRFLSPVYGEWWAGARITLGIIVLNFAIWFVFIIGNAITHGKFESFFKIFLADHPETTFQKLYLWTLITSGFVHFDFMHVFFNMLILFFFAPQIERDFGSKKFLLFYLICLVGSGLVSILAKTIIIMMNTSPSVITGATNVGVSIGASGAVMGVLIAYGMIYPLQTVYVLGMFPVKMRTLIIAIVVIQLAMAFQDAVRPGSGGNTDYWAHIGGLATGFVYMKLPGYSSRGGPKRPRKKTINWKGEESGDERSYYLEV